MIFENFFTISEFAKLMGVSRQTLIYYDRIGLFKPVKILENKYRVYSRSQVNLLSLITILTEMGVPLKEIKRIVDRISPDTAIQVLERQQKQAEEKLRKLNLLKDMMGLRIEQITLGKAVLEGKVPPLSIVEQREDIPLYLGERIDCTWRDMADDTVIDFYSKCEALELPLIFSGGQMKTKENILAGRTELISHMCFPLRCQAGANEVIPKGRYAVGYVHGDGENTGESYRELLTFIGEKGMEVVGNAYEEYLLDELTEGNPDHFVIKIMIQVEPAGEKMPPKG